MIFTSILSSLFHSCDKPTNQQPAVATVSSLATRAETAYAGVFGYELDITKADDEEFEAIKAQITKVKALRTIMRTGDFYRIQSPYETNYCSWETVAKDKSEAFVFSCRVLSVANSQDRRIRLKGLDPTALYVDAETGKVYGGDELMYIGILPEYAKADFASYTAIFKRL